MHIDIAAEVQKYRNKARFFEDQIVEKEQETAQWKTKYEGDLLEHTRSQDALIHGFNAEISNLKAQISQFRKQYHGSKSPNKSPGRSLRSPDVKMKLFPMSPLSTSSKDLNSSGMSTCSSPRESRKHDVNEQVKALQNELDKNCEMIKELEHALQASRSTVSELEKKLESEAAKKENVETKEADVAKKEVGCQKESPNDGDSLNEQIVEKDKEINILKEKVTELEPLMKDYFSMSKKLTDADKKSKELNEKLEDKINQVIRYEQKIIELETEVSGLQKQVNAAEEKYEKLEEHAEVVDTLNNELKGMVDVTTTELETKETELSILSPKFEKLQKKVESEPSVDDMKKELAEKSKEIVDLQMKLTQLRTNCSVKEIAYKDATEKCLEYEFKSDEKEIENEDLKRQLSDGNKRLAELDSQTSNKTDELQNTGEELALAAQKVRKLQRLIEEHKSSINDLESALASKDLELIEQDKQLDEKGKEADQLRTELKTLTEDLNSVRKEDKDAHKILDETKEVESKLNKEITELREKEKSLEEKFVQLETTLREQQQWKVDTTDKHLAEVKQSQLELDNVKKSHLIYTEEQKVSMNTIRDKYQKKVDEVAKLGEQIDNMEFENLSLQGEISELGEQLSNLKNELKDKEYEAEAQKSKNKQLENQTEAKSKEESSDKKLSDATVEIADLKASVHTHKSLHHKVKGELQEALLTIENNRSELEQYKKNAGSMKDVQKELGDVQKELLDKTDELVCAEKVLGEIRETLKRRDAQLEELHNDLRNINATSIQKAKNKETNEKKQKVLEDTISEKNEMIIELEGKLKSCTDDIEVLNQKINELDTSADSASTEKQKTIAELHGFIDKIGELASCGDLSKDNLTDKHVASYVETICDSVQGSLDKNKDIERLSEEVEKFKAEKDKCLEKLDKLSDENGELKNKLTEGKRNKDSENELKSQLTLKEVECETINLELKVLKETFQKEKDELNSELKDYKERQTDDDSDTEKSDHGCDTTNTDKLAEIQRLYDAEKVKNEEYQKLLTDTSEMHCFSPQTGVRKLRKEKIEIQNSLVEARFKVSTLESKVTELEMKVKTSTSDVCDAIVNQDPLTQRKLKHTTAKLQETEERNRALIKEVTQLQGEVERLEVDLR